MQDFDVWHPRAVLLVLRIRRMLAARSGVTYEADSGLFLLNGDFLMLPAREGLHAMVDPELARSAIERGQGEPSAALARPEGSPWLFILASELVAEEDLALWVVRALAWGRMNPRRGNGDPLRIRSGAA